MSQWLADKAYTMGRWLDRRAMAQEAQPSERVIVPVGVPVAAKATSSYRVLSATSTFMPTPQPISASGGHLLHRPSSLVTSAAHVFHPWPAQGAKTSSSVNQYP